MGNFRQARAKQQQSVPLITGCCPLWSFAVCCYYRSHQPTTLCCCCCYFCFCFCRLFRLAAAAAVAQPVASRTHCRRNTRGALLVFLVYARLVSSSTKAGRLCRPPLRGSSNSRRQHRHTDTTHTQTGLTHLPLASLWPPESTGPIQSSLLRAARSVAAKQPPTSHRGRN